MTNRPHVRVRRVASLALGTACVLLQVSCQQPPAQALVVGTVRLPGTALLYIAESRGCFGGGGSPISLKAYSSGRDALAAMRQGQVAVAVAFQTPVVINALEDPSLRILTTLHAASASSSHVVARADRGIRSAADLARKRIGLPRRTSAESFTRSLLVFHGIDPAAVTVVDVAPDEVADALSSGRVDAIASWSPYVERAAAAVPPAMRVELFSDVYSEVSMLVTRTPVLAAEGPALQKLVRCLADAQRAVDATPDRGYSLAVALFADLDREALAEQWKHTALEVGLQNSLLGVLHEEADWLELPTDRAKFAALCAPEFLERAMPESVTFAAR